MMEKDARDVTLALLAKRAAAKTICPSEVARAMAATVGERESAMNWRSVMPAVHMAVDGLVAEGLVRLSWKGEFLNRRNGPYRISRGARD